MDFTKPLLAIAAGALAILPGSLQQASADPGTSLSEIQLAAQTAMQNQTSLDAQMDTPGPKQVLIDAATGHVIALKSTSMSTRIAIQNICTSGQACYYSGQVPYANVGFYGTPGTQTGNWPSRSGYYSGNYRVQVCWYSGKTVCSGATPPNVTAIFTGLVPGIAVIIL